MKYNSLAIVGPSTSGKTDAAIAIAKKHNGALICCDMVQIWKGYEIGSGMPTKEETGDLPMYLYGALEPTPGSRLISKQDYYKLASKARRETIQSRFLPVFEGCSSNYTRVLLGDPNPPEFKHQKPFYPAIEYGEFPVFVLIPSLDGLYQRLEKRLIRFWEQGVVEEVQRLLGKPTVKRERPAPMKAGIIYNHLSRYLCENPNLLTQQLDNETKARMHKDLHDQILNAWEKNIKKQTETFKALFDEFPDRPLIWIDVDPYIPEKTTEQLEYLVKELISAA
jgi:tRNA A37 N6-isopentenylltransferase MiaA